MILLDANKLIVPGKRPRRVGRGASTGHGRRSGRGHRGQLGRSGVSFHPYFEGGQMPLSRKLAKRGFNNKRFQIKRLALSTTILEKHFKDGEIVNISELGRRGLISGGVDSVKIIKGCELTKKLSVEAHAFSKGAKAAIEKVGGRATTIANNVPKVVRIPLSVLDNKFEAGEKISADSLVQKKILKGGERFRITSEGIVTKKLGVSVKWGFISRAAVNKIRKNGGKVVILPK